MIIKMMHWKPLRSRALYKSKYMLQITWGSEWLSLKLGNAQHW